ncbi:MAG: uncharacterized protein JWQ89_4486 [Devosia sp.]|uniref:nucleotidyltransferase family protein n=1 Tax=Devosia sp. TaxID=1871048 RepID=UPI00262BAF8D|nr:nucleotidyltransferase domain-containing protein [Devosia sp.]MDB5542759.1 uncharacterized protein [Devosia sp.]
MVVTIAARKAGKTERLQRAIAAAMQRLASYAAGHAGRFLVFGSAARGELRFDSDFDVVVAFPKAAERTARDYAEAISIELGLKPDIILIGDACSSLLERVHRDAVVLQ